MLTVVYKETCLLPVRFLVRVRKRLAFSVGESQVNKTGAKPIARVC